MLVWEEAWAWISKSAYQNDSPRTMCPGCFGIRDIDCATAGDTEPATLVPDTSHEVVFLYRQAWYYPPVVPLHTIPSMVVTAMRTCVLGYPLYNEGI